jgi:ribosomal protein RSM22 (predicted rRNA methylase)
MEPPQDLRSALAAHLGRIPPRELSQAVRRLSDRYRSPGHSDAPLLTSALDVAAYAAYRLPATYAAIAAVLTEVRERRPDLRPKSLLDVGGGPGTAAWAAMAVWPELSRITIVERDERMVDLGRSLAADAGAAALREASWQQRDITDPWDVPAADLTIAAYVLGELPEATQDGVVRWLWEHSRDSAVIVEPGTPRGFARVQAAAEELRRLDADIVAPFPPHWPCLEHAGDWCHFAQRVARTRLHRSAKDATLAYEDEKYSYVAASREPGDRIAGRVIRQPQIRSGHVRLVICTADGVKHLVVTRSNRAVYRHARDLRWGSAIRPEDAAAFGLPVRSPVRFYSGDK